MEKSMDMVKLGVAILITMILIGFAILAMNSGKDTAQTGINEMDAMSAGLVESKYTMYDGVDIKGSEVLNIIRKFKDDYVGIKVITGKNSGGAWYIYNGTESSGSVELNSEIDFDLANAQDKSNNEYINPNGKFAGKVYRDGNGSITALIFEQK